MLNQARGFSALGLVTTCVHYGPLPGGHSMHHFPNVRDLRIVFVFEAYQFMFLSALRNTLDIKKIMCYRVNYILIAVLKVQKISFYDHYLVTNESVRELDCLTKELFLIKLQKKEGEL